MAFELILVISSRTRSLSVVFISMRWLLMSIKRQQFVLIVTVLSTQLVQSIMIFILKNKKIEDSVHRNKVFNLFSLVKVAMTFRAFNTGLVTKVTIRPLMRSGMIKGVKPTATAADQPIFPRKCRLRIPPTKTSASPKTKAKKLFQIGVLAWVSADVTRAKKDRQEDSQLKDQRRIEAHRHLLRKRVNQQRQE